MKHILTLATVFINLSGEDCLSGVQLTGPSVVEANQLPNPWVDLTCSFNYKPLEYSQLDLKWYFSTEEEPFLQWVPSSGRKPQTIGQKFKNRLEVSHNSRNTSDGFRIDQNIRVERPSVHLSGDYTCKVAAFLMEESSTHNLIIFDPGLGPLLSYNTVEEQINLSCQVEQVFPEPKLSLNIYTEKEDQSTKEYGNRMPKREITTTTVRRGLKYDVMVNTIIPLSTLSMQTVLSCSMEIPGTQFSLKKETMYIHRSLSMRSSQVSKGSRHHTKYVGAVIVMGILVIGKVFNNVIGLSL